MVYDVTADPYFVPNDGTDQTTKIRDTLAAIITAMNGKGGVIYFPAGRYGVSGNVLNITGATGTLGITIRGDGPGHTTFDLKNDVSLSTYIFSVAASNPASPANWFAMRDFTMAGYKPVESRWKANWVNLSGISRVRMERLEFAATQGIGFNGSPISNACFHDVHFGFVGDNTSGSEASQMRIRPSADNSVLPVNITLESCRWERNYNHGLELIGVRHGALLSCKHHGELDDPVNPGPHMICRGCFGLMIVGHRSTNSATSLLRLTTLAATSTISRGCIALSSRWDNADANFAIEFDQCEHCGIVGNNFALPTGLGVNANKPDDVTLTAGTDNTTIIRKLNAGDTTVNS